MSGGALKAVDLVQDLVHQFSETLSFYRELIQNSIDAGSNRIDVALDYGTLPSGRRGVIMSVEDDGEGMNEKIIDNYLLVLFRSTKDDDLTKIGKFGIGFVSVFAPKPQLVRVSTARDGESWRLDLHSVERFDKYKMPRLRDGTLVELFKELPQEEYAGLVAESRATVSYWCRHSDTKITFRDRWAKTPPEAINSAFDLEGGCSLRYEEEGTQVVMGPAWTAVPEYGFYNRGLTLKEGEAPFVPAVRFKVKSRYLEHTLTRDNVVRDANFEKAMALVKRLAADELPGKVLAECSLLAADLSKAAAKNDAEACARLSELWGRRLPYLIALFNRRWTFFKSWDKEPILAGVGGAPISVKQAKDGLAHGYGVFADHRRTPVTDALDALGKPVLFGGAWAADVAKGLIGAAGITGASESFFYPQLLDERKLEPGLRALVERARAVDAESAYRYQTITVADFGYEGSTIAEKIFVVQNEAGALSPIGELPVSSFFRRKKRGAVLNAAHPFIRKLAAIHGSRPGLAVFMLLKTLHLHDGEVPAERRSAFTNLSEKTERGLLEAALRLDAGGAA